MYAYLGNKIRAISEQLMNRALLIKEMFGESVTEIDCITTVTLCQKINYVTHISEEVLNSSVGQVKPLV
jgi:hypothetical protein